MKLLVFSFMLLALIGNASPASFDCSKATAQHEKAICGNPALSALDEKLANAYRNLQKLSPDPEKNKKEQIEWIRNVRKCQDDVSCIEKLYVTRFDEINSLIGQKLPQPSAASSVADSSTLEKSTNIALPAASAPEATPAVPSASAAASVPAAVVSAIKEDSGSKRDINLDPDYKKYGLIAVGGLIALIVAYFILKLVISISKRAAAKAKSAASEGVSKISEESERLKDEFIKKSKELTDSAVSKAALLSEQASVAGKNLLTEVNKEGGHKDFIQEKAKGLTSKIVPKFKIALDAYFILFKMHPWIVGFLTLLVIALLFGGGGSVSKDYKTDVTYVYHSDGSCPNHAGTVCIDIKQAEYLCGKLQGVTNSFYKNLKYGVISDKARTLISEGSVGAFGYKWNGRQCIADVSASGLYKGNSAKVKLSGYITDFIVDKERNVLLHNGYLSEEW